MQNILENEYEFGSEEHIFSVVLGNLLKTKGVPLNNGINAFQSLYLADYEYQIELMLNKENYLDLRLELYNEDLLYCSTIVKNPCKNNFDRKTYSKYMVSELVRIGKLYKNVAKNNSLEEDNFEEI